MSKHTPDNPLPKLGLGSVGKFNDGQYVEADDEAFVSSEGEDPDYEIAIKGPEAKRVARLITAAPILLDIAESLVTEVARLRTCPATIRMLAVDARAALSKARAT